MVHFGGIHWINGSRVHAVNADTKIRIFEVTHTTPPEELFEARIENTDFNGRGYQAYRGMKFFDFYGRGDVDLDGDVDMNDLNVIVRARNRPANGPLDPRDLDRDGMITALDARIAVTLFTP